MYKLKDNKEIGKHLDKLIKKNANYKSIRDFCRAYLRELNKDDENEQNVQRMAGRLSGFKNEGKPVKIDDLYYFTKLLDVSCEEILSAGDAKSITENHLTNYQVANSHEEKIWQAYIENKHKPFLNPDEYDKTIIDYAFEFQNYDLLKYLMDNGYIWFVSKTPEKDCWLGFGAKTSVKRRQDCNFKTLEERLAEDDGLRRKMIVLAIKQGDIKILDELRAREIPPMYRLRPIRNATTDFEKFYNTEMVEALSKADETILDYFSKEITVKTDYRDTPQTFMFPAIGMLLEKLIANNNKCTKAILNKCIEHNRKTFELVKEIAERQTDYYHRGFFEYSKDGNIINVSDYQLSSRDNANDWVVTNIIRVNSQSDSFVISDLINELNKSFDDILALDLEKGEK